MKSTINHCKGSFSPNEYHMIGYANKDTRKPSTRMKVNIFTFPFFFENIVLIKITITKQANMPDLVMQFTGSSWLKPNMQDAIHIENPWNRMCVSPSVVLLYLEMCVCVCVWLQYKYQHTAVQEFRSKRRGQKKRNHDANRHQYIKRIEQIVPFGRYFSHDVMNT